MAREPDAQLNYVRKAVDLLGGQSATTNTLRLVCGRTISERHLRHILAGDRILHTGLLRDLASALLAHAKACQMLERRLSPAFNANLTTTQTARPRHGNSYDLRQKKA